METQQNELPLIPMVSFNKLLQRYDGQVNHEDELLALKAKQILEAQAPYPELREGFTDLTLLEKHKGIIELILSDLFPESLTNNEIKAASLPFFNTIFNPTNRFEKIIQNAERILT